MFTQDLSPVWEGRSKNGFGEQSMQPRNNVRTTAAIKSRIGITCTHNTTILQSLNWKMKSEQLKYIMHTWWVQKLLLSRRLLVLFEDYWYIWTFVSWTVFSLIMYSGCKLISFPQLRLYSHIASVVSVHPPEKRDSSTRLYTPNMLREQQETLCLIGLDTIALIRVNDWLLRWFRRQTFFACLVKQRNPTWQQVRSLHTCICRNIHCECFFGKMTPNNTFPLEILLKTA